MSSGYPKKAAKKHPAQAAKQPLYEEIKLEKGEIIEITKDMIIGDVVLAYPETIDVLRKVGVHCVGCHASTYESIEEGVRGHGIDPDKVCKQLNQIIKKTRKK